MKTQSIKVKLRDGEMGAYLAIPDKKPVGAVIAIMEIWGVNDTMRHHAHEFAEASGDFAKLHATVIGVSRDNIDTLNKFSVSECRSKFPVAADGDGKITQAYDVSLKLPASMGGREVANRTSYVIAPTGEIIYEYTSLDTSKHVENTMSAVKSWEESHAH